MIAINELNEMYRNFWLVETAEAENRMREPGVVALAVHFVKSEGDRRIPFTYRVTFELALAQACEAKSLIVEHATRRAGSASRKLDPLGRFIAQAVESNPRLSQRALVHALKKAVEADGPIAEVTENHVVFTADNGKFREISIEVLKDRLSRSKKRRLTRN
jgi:hypothetical protein